MLLLPISVSLLLTTLTPVSSIQIISSSPHSSTVVPEGSNITLSCSSSVPWFFCLWNSPRNEKQCAIQEDEVRGVCSKAGQDSSSSSLSGATSSKLSAAALDEDNESHLSVYKLSGARHQCSLFVDKVTRHMHGDWMCLLNEISDFNSVKHTVQLKVGVGTQLSWSVLRETDSRARPHALPVLDLTEGDHVSIACEASEGFPVMQFSWEHHVVTSDVIGDSSSNNVSRPRAGREYQERSWDSSANSGLVNNTRKAVYSVSGGSHLYSGSQTVDYVANITHNNSVLICKTSQWVDSDESQTEPLYTRSISLTLNISPIVIISSNTHLHERLGVISGIILAIIFIILIFILLSIFLTRRRKTDKKYSSLADKTSSEDLLKPIWVPGKSSKSRVQVGSAREFVNEYQQFGEGRELEDCSAISVSGRRSQRGREVLHSPDRDHHHHHHCQSHDHHESCHLQRMVYVKQHNPTSGSSAHGNVTHHPVATTCAQRHVCTGDTCLDVRDTVLDISVETHSDHSSTEHSRNISTAASVSRPTTRTTKTISDGSDSSRSSVLIETKHGSLERHQTGSLERERQALGSLERHPRATDNVESFLRATQENMESYISFQSEIRDHSDAIYSPNSTLNSQSVSERSGLVSDLHHSMSHPSCTGDSVSHKSLSHAAPDSVSLMHETHFGDSLTDIPRTVISAITHTDKMSQEDLDRITRRYSLVKLRNTIFDCEEGCFISFEEFGKRISQESLNKIKE